MLNRSHHFIPPRMPLFNPPFHRHLQHPSNDDFKEMISVLPEEDLAKDVTDLSYAQLDVLDGSYRWVQSELVRPKATRRNAFVIHASPEQKKPVVSMDQQELTSAILATRMHDLSLSPKLPLKRGLPPRAKSHSIRSSPRALPKRRMKPRSASFGEPQLVMGTVDSDPVPNPKRRMNKEPVFLGITEL